MDPRAVERMTLRRAYSLADYWAEFPPIHEVARMFAAAYLGWNASGASPSDEPFKESSEEDIRAFVAAAQRKG